MIGDAFVIDAVVHGYNFTPENAPGREKLQKEFVDDLYNGALQAVPAPHILPKEQWIAATDPDLVGHSLFSESRTDFGVYHDVPIYGIFDDGGSPMWVGKKMAQQWPNRLAFYGAVSPWRPGVLDEVERHVTENGVVGIKLYPLDIVDGEMKTVDLSDEDNVFPILERAQQLGLKSVAIHKAVPIGRVPMKPFEVGDVQNAAAAFPDLTIEIVHGGVAFVEETAWLLESFPNVAINLEGTVALLFRAPIAFAKVLGTFIKSGAANRMFWATGCMAFHPQELLERFWAMETPRELLDEGLSEITTEHKRNILGENFARLHGWDIETLKRQIGPENLSTDQELLPLWSRGAA